MAVEHKVHIVLLTVDLLVPHSDSLKSKRRVLKSLKDRIGAKFNVSIAEIAHLDEWQRALIGMVMISNERQHLERSLSAIGKLIEETGDIQLLDVSREWI